jgi:branched-chain amino acid aminotransferase
MSTNEPAQIKYEELPSFSEVLAAGTAAALVPIKSITRRSRFEKFEYIAEDSEEPGPVLTKLLTTLKGIQLGKIEGPSEWCIPVKEVDIKKYSATEYSNGVNGLNGHVDKLY